MLKKRLKKAISIFQWLLTAVLVLAVLLLIFTAFNPIKSFQLFRVMSGSMEPKIKVGSVVFVRKVKPEVLKKNEVITYTSSENPDISITHRLVEIEEKEGKTVFKTRGDANNNEDMAEVSPSQIKGRVVFSLPFLGYLSVWIKKPLGFGLLVILPALLIIVSEILSIKKAIEKEVEKKYAERGKAKENKVTASLFIFFLLGISLFKIRPAEAYFSDVLIVGGNTFSMASDWVSPTPSPTISPTPAEVVINEVYYDVASEKGSEETNEWIELYNNTSQPVDISGWKIKDNQGLSYQRTIPSSSPIPSHGYAVITPDSSTWSYWSEIPTEAIKIVLGISIGNGLSNDGDRVILKRPDGVEVDSMSYGTDTYAFSPACPDVTFGHSLSRKPAGKDTNTAVDWIDTHIGSTPRGPNPGMNPHNEDGSLVVPTTTPESSVTPIITPTPTPTVTPELSSESSATSSATTVEPIPTPSLVPETSPTPTPTIEPSPTPEPTPTAEPTPAPSTTPTPSPTPSLSPTPSPASELPTYEIA